MNETGKLPAPQTKGGNAMEFLIFVGILVLWIVLQAWVLPRLGIPT